MSALTPLITFHLATVLPAFLIGTLILFRRKGTASHRSLGRVYLVLMLATALASLGIPAQVGPQWRDHWGLIHALSLLTLVSVPAAYFAARRHNIPLHRGIMIGLYVGGLLIAGLFAFMPGRLLHQWLLA